MIAWTRETQELATLAIAKFDRLSESELKMRGSISWGDGQRSGPLHSRKLDCVGLAGSIGLVHPPPKRSGTSFLVLTAQVEANL
jgi:hypothetical protein